MPLGVVFSADGVCGKRGNPERPQMIDIARLAGVSVATVSRALNGEGSVRRPTKARHARIVEIANALNYQVEEAARHLRSGRTKTISVVVPCSSAFSAGQGESQLLNLIGGISEALTEKGHDLLLSRVDMSQPERITKEYETGRVAGGIAIGQGGDPKVLEKLAIRGVPLVAWGPRKEGQSYVSVGCDDVLGGRMATEHLLQGGAQRIVFIGDIRDPDIALQLRGYLHAHSARGLRVHSELMLTERCLHDRLALQVKFLVRSDPKIDAIYASSDEIAIGVINALRRMGKRVPEDIAVVGYGDHPLAAQFHPTLTTIGYSAKNAGQKLVGALMGILEGEFVESDNLPIQLFVRDSSRTVRRFGDG